MHGDHQQVQWDQAEARELDQDGAGAVNAAPIAQAIVEGLPLAKENVIDHEYIAIGPLLPLRLLMANPQLKQ